RDLPDDDPSWVEALRFLSDRPAPRTGRDRSVLLETMRLLGDPQARFPAVHVAGTNGKGSTTHAVASILSAAGLRTGSYFSPYLFDISERWRIDGEPISRSEVVALIGDIRFVVQRAEETVGARLSEFELKTALAFLLFYRRAVDIAVVEVGIGGRLDATNIIPPPLVAAITSIGLDHVQILGNTRAEIAAEKAGILKTGTLACVTPVDDPEAGSVIARFAGERGVPLVHVQAESAPPFLGFDAPYARLNRATAMGVVDVLRSRAGYRVSPEAIERGLSSGRLPGRFQCIPLGDRTLVLDVAHNADGATALAAGLREAFPGAPITAVIGMSAHHSPAELLGPLAPLLTSVVATEPVFRPAPAESVAVAADFRGLSHRTVIPVADAVRAAWHATPRGGVCLVTGSFFVVGDIPRELDGTQIR
ncbi:MAG: bifunctional folylpolyglutamate synthase/dihydrofolate synthase, partial [Armatimonadota bacterium]